MNPKPRGGLGNRLLKCIPPTSTFSGSSGQAQQCQLSLPGNLWVRIDQQPGQAIDTHPKPAASNKDGGGSTGDGIVAGEGGGDRVFPVTGPKRHRDLADLVGQQRPTTDQRGTGELWSGGPLGPEPEQSPESHQQRNLRGS